MNNNEKVPSRTVPAEGAGAREKRELASPASVTNLHERMKESPDRVWDNTRGEDYRRIAIKQQLPFEEFEKIFTEMVTNEIPIADRERVGRDSFGKGTVLSIMREYIARGDSEYFSNLPETLRQISVHYRSKKTEEQGKALRADLLARE